MTDFKHQTVLLHETVAMLGLRSGDIAIDATSGGGGHTDLLLKSVGGSGRVIAMDRDLRAINTLKARFAKDLDEGRLVLVQNSFSNIGTVAREQKVHGAVAGICADLGVSSPQLDEADRGFSFAKLGPLDMRMTQDESGTTTAADIVNSADERDLTQMFREFGEEPKAHFIARAIVRAREKAPIETTSQLADIVAAAVHYKERSRKHPATKVFQALRIVVNNELGELDTLLDDGFACLRSGGRLGIISFHSLEDRRVKQKFVSLYDRVPESAKRNAPMTDAELQRAYPALAKPIKPYPCKPSDEEIQENTRSRSAILRVIEKS